MRLPALTFPFSALALFAFIAGCATPQYQSNIRLVPPTNAAGRACVQNCETQKNACQADCQNRYQACVKAIESQVGAHYVEALKKYEIDLKRYAMALRRYEMELRYEWLNSYPYYYPYGWNPWPRAYYPPPYPAPVMPTREGVRAQLQASSCQADCGCLPAYDACFVECGGQRLIETLCVKNCPPAK